MHMMQVDIQKSFLFFFFYTTSPFRAVFAIPFGLNSSKKIQATSCMRLHVTLVYPFNPIIYERKQ